MSCIRAWLLLWTALAVTSVGAIDDKCEACRIVARELIARLEAEGPRNHIDMRHRIDPDGKRYGKVIEYRLSELRMVELLEGLCDVSQNYTWGYRNPNDGRPLEIGWVHVKASREIAFDMSKEERKSRRVEFNAYCGRLIEVHEEELVEAIQNGFNETSELVEMLCGQLEKACPAEPSPTHAEL